MADLYKYGTAVHLYKPMIKRGVVDFAVSADWTPAAGDVKISKDGGAAASVTNLPVAITMGNTAMWDFSLTATEMQASKIRITVADSATKAVEDTFFEIDTYGNASAQHAVDFSDIVRLGLTALPNVASGSAGAIPTTGTGANQINVSGGRADADVKYQGGAAIAPRYTGTTQAATGATATLANGTTALQAAIGDMLVITSGPGAGQSGIIISQTGMGTATPIVTITNAWATLPTASGYEIIKLGGLTPAQPSDLWNDSYVPTRTLTAPTNITSDDTKVPISSISAIKAKTDSLVVTSGKVDANVKQINSVDLTGTGVPTTDPWRPA